MPYSEQPLPETVPPVHSKTPLFIGLALVVLVIIVIAGAFAYTHRSTGPSSSTSTDTTTTGGNQIFSDTGISFTYPANWQYIGANALATSTTDSTTENHNLFYTSSDLATAKLEIAGALKTVSSTTQASQISLLFEKVDNQAQLDVNRLVQTSAQQAALDATQDICKGTNLYSSTQTAQSSEVVAVTSGSLSGWEVLPQAGCTYQVTQLFLDSKSTISVATPTPVPTTTPTPNASSAPISVVATPSATTDAFDISFIGAANLQHLTSDQQLVLGSLKLQ